MRPFASIRRPAGSAIALAVAGLVVAAGTAGAQGPGLSGPGLTGLDGGKSLVPMPYNANPAVTLAIDVSKRQPKIGEWIELCFSASRDGYVTLWDVGTSGRAARMFPNQLSNSDAAATRVTGGQRYCAGKDGDAFAFEVGGPTGQDELYIVWTATPEAQPQSATFPDAAGLAAAIDALKKRDPATWATYKTSFEVVGPNGPTVPQLPPPQNNGATPPPPAPAPAPAAPSTPAPASPSAPAPSAPAAPGPSAAAPAANGPRPQVYVLAMGSNVEPLTKSNQDAAMFVSGFQRLFAVPQDHIRLYNNVYRAQFKEGMDWLRAKAQPTDFVVIYYSGHGAQIPDDDGDESSDGKDEAFVTYDVEGKQKPTPADLVRDDEYAAWVNALKTNQVLSVIDACHSGGLTRGFGEVVMGANPKFYIMPESANTGAPGVAAKSFSLKGLSLGKAMPKGTTLAAAREDQSALEGATGSIFTLALMETLNTQRSGTMADVFSVASQTVNARTESRQTPVMAGERTVAERIVLR